MTEVPSAGPTGVLCDFLAISSHSAFEAVTAHHRKRRIARVARIRRRALAEAEDRAARGLDPA